MAATAAATDEPIFMAFRPVHTWVKLSLNWLVYFKEVASAQRFSLVTTGVTPSYVMFPQQRQAPQSYVSLHIPPAAPAAGLLSSK